MDSVDAVEQYLAVDNTQDNKTTDYTTQNWGITLASVWYMRTQWLVAITATSC